MSLPQRLLAPAPGWIVETDVVVVGSGHRRADHRAADRAPAVRRCGCWW